MNIKHHLTEEILAGYSAGRLTEAADLLVAAHISMCDHCRALSETYDALGGALLEATPDDTTPVSGDSFAATMALIRSAPRDSRTPAPKTTLPAPLVDYVGGDIEAIKWTPVGMGIKQSKLINAKDATARLLFIPAGVAVPHHGHNGQELTLVLQGAFDAASDHFGPGDVEIADQDVEHTPTAVESQDCVCLAVTDASLKFKSLLPRLIQPFIGI